MEGKMAISMEWKQRVAKISIRECNSELIDESSLMNIL
jgi:hypothetical protein